MLHRIKLPSKQASMQPTQTQEKIVNDVADGMLLRVKYDCGTTVSTRFNITRITYIKLLCTRTAKVKTTRSSRPQNKNCTRSHNIPNQRGTEGDMGAGAVGQLAYNRVTRNSGHFYRKQHDALALACERCTKKQDHHAIAIVKINSHTSCYFRMRHLTSNCIKVNFQPRVPH